MSPYPRLTSLGLEIEIGIAKWVSVKRIKLIRGNLSSKGNLGAKIGISQSASPKMGRK